MRMKKPLSIGFVALLLLSMAIVIAPVPVSAGPAPDIWMECIEGELDTLEYCDSFTVSVLVNITDPPGLATGLYGWEYYLIWDPVELSLTGKVEPDLVADFGWSNGYWVKKNISPAPGYFANESVWCSATAMSPDPSFTGVMWLSNYTFHVEMTVYEPDPTRTGHILMDLIGLVDDQVGDIVPPFTGRQMIEFNICPKPIPKPELRIVPMKTHGVCSQLFNVSIGIYDLYPGWNLWGWEAKLRYNPAYITAMASYEGPFLPSFVTPPHANATTYINQINFAADTVLSAGSFNDPNHTAPQCPGAVGIVSIIEFNASVQTIAPEIVTFALELYDTKLPGVDANQTVYPIEHTVRNGTYNVPYKIVGWSLDCYTDVFRKKCEAAYTGIGINQTADAYEPQDLVILYAYLEYNFEPEAYKLVTFEVHGPPNSYMNITIYRTAWTNASGIATINFTIPGSGVPEWQEMVMGHWECYQAAQVKIYEKPFDWLYWKVGWIIEIINVTVGSPTTTYPPWENPEGPKKCEWIEILIEYKTIAFINKTVVFTITVLDELLDPIQWEFVVILVEPTEYYLCSEREDSLVVWSHIPMWAHVGKATVFVNAFTDLPSSCGCPYCPEKTAIFWVIATADP